MINVFIFLLIIFKIKYNFKICFFFNFKLNIYLIYYLKYNSLLSKNIINILYIYILYK